MREYEIRQNSSYSKRTGETPEESERIRQNSEKLLEDPEEIQENPKESTRIQENVGQTGII